MTHDMSACLGFGLNVVVVTVSFEYALSLNSDDENKRYSRSWVLFGCLFQREGGLEGSVH